MKAYGRKKHGKACDCCYYTEKNASNKTRARRDAKKEIKNEIRDTNKRRKKDV